MRSDPGDCRHCNGVGEDDESGRCDACDGSGRRREDCIGCGETFFWEDMNGDWCRRCGARASDDEALWDRADHERDLANDDALEEARR